MQVFHTAGVPPKSGSTILAIMGCIRKSRAELKNNVTEKKNCNEEPPARAYGFIGGEHSAADFPARRVGRMFSNRFEKSWEVPPCAPRVPLSNSSKHAERGFSIACSSSALEESSKCN